MTGSSESDRTCPQELAGTDRTGARRLSMQSITAHKVEVGEKCLKGFHLAWFCLAATTSLGVLAPATSAAPVKTAPSYHVRTSLRRVPTTTCRPEAW